MSTTRTTYINLTPHTICLANESGLADTADIPPSGKVARMVPYEWQRSPRVESAEKAGLGVMVREHQSLSSYRIEGLPDPEPDTIYLVSLLCLDAAQEQKRGDVYAPDTSPGSGCIRDSSGQIAAVRRLVRAYTPR